MQFLFDHISSFIIFAAIVLIVALMQLRGMQTNAESAVNYMVRTGTLEISEILERDLMNMRTEAQTIVADNNGVFDHGGLGYDCSLTVNGDTTLTFSFPTLSDPQADIADPLLAPVAQVMYQLTAESGAISRVVEGDTLTHNIFRLDRFVAGQPNGWSDSGVTFFRVEFAARDNPAFQVPAGGDCPANLSKVRFQILMAKDFFAEVSEQKSTSQLNFSRYGGTVELSNWD